MHDKRLSKGRLLLSIVLIYCLPLLLNGCSSLAWYRQAALGQLDILQRREPIAEVIEDPATPAELAQQLRYLQQARQFAIDYLKLPNNGSYQDFAALNRDAAVWTLIVTPSLSLSAKQWCYPLVGCQSYRGYFKEHKAIQAAHRWELQGYDALVLNTPAYSTLGWFDDPILDTMLQQHDEDTAGVIFHELAHQVLYVKGDTAFNEAYASFVERAGTRLWLQMNHEPSRLNDWEKRTLWRQNYYYMLQTARDELAQLYGGQTSMEYRQQMKQAILQTLRQNLIAQQMPVPDPLNNARLAIVATYEQGVERFQELFECHNSHWESFHHAVAILGDWPAERRHDWLEGKIDTHSEVCHLTRAQRTNKDKP